MKQETNNNYKPKQGEILGVSLEKYYSRMKRPHQWVQFEKRK